jgi:hypothetical protein
LLHLQIQSQYSKAGKVLVAPTDTESNTARRKVLVRPAGTESSTERSKALVAPTDTESKTKGAKYLLHLQVQSQE